MSAAGARAGLDQARPLRGGLVRAGAMIALARVSSLVLAAVQLPVLTRLVPADSYAQLPLATSLAVYVGLFAADPVILAFQRFPGTDGDRASYRRARRSVLVGLLAAAALLVAAGLVFGWADLAAAVVAWGAGLAANRFAAMAWLMWGDERRYAVNLSASTLSRTLALIGGCAVGLPLPWAIATAGLVSTAVALALAPRAASRPTEARAAGTTWTYRLGVGLAAGQLAATVLATSSLVIVTAVIGADASGPFGTMTQVAVVAAAGLNLVTTAVYPRLRAVWDSGRRREARAMIGAAGYVFVATGAASAAIVTAGDAWILRRLVPGEFVLAPALGPLMAGAAFASIGVASGWVHQLSLRARTVALRSATAAVVGTAATITLVLWLGAVGGAVGSLAGFVGLVLLLTPGTRWMPLPLVACLGLLAAIAVLGLVPGVPSAAVSGGFAGVAALATAAAALSARTARAARLVDATRTARTERSRHARPLV